MWRRACRGERESLVTVALVGFALWWFAVSVTAACLGWPHAIVLAMVSGLTLLTIYAMRRRASTTWFRSQSEVAVAAFEAMLRQPDDHG